MPICSPFGFWSSLSSLQGRKPRPNSLCTFSVLFLLKECEGSCIKKRGHSSSGNTPQKPPAKKAILNTPEEQGCRRTPKRLSFSKKCINLVKCKLQQIL